MNKTIKKDSYVSICFDIEMQIGELAKQISDTLSDNQLLALIVALDLTKEDWDFTGQLIGHFKAMEQEYQKELQFNAHELEENPFPSKKIEI